MLISHSVGRGGQNRPDDVRVVTARLGELGYDWVAGSFQIDGDTIATIRLFQAIKNGHQQIAHVDNDGLIEPGGDTARWLASPRAPRWQLQPVGSAAAGFVSSERADEADLHDYGTDWLAEALLLAGADYRDRHLLVHPGAALMTVNDASLPRGGPTAIHKGHQTGLSCDLRLPRLDGSAGKATWRDEIYDQAAARAILQALRSQPQSGRIFFNDEALIAEGLCQPSPGHDNHVHFEVRPPRGA